MIFQELVKVHGLKAGQVALTVGTLLLMVNQYDGIFGQEPFRLLPALITYVVPFVVFLLGKGKEGVGC